MDPIYALARLYMQRHNQIEGENLPSDNRETSIQVPNGKVNIGTIKIINSTNDPDLYVKCVQVCDPALPEHDIDKYFVELSVVQFKNGFLGDLVTFNIYPDENINQFILKIDPNDGGLVIEEKEEL